MSNKEIIVCTTMRDFQGSNNDQIQLKFLNSLKKQEDVKINLVITLFGEKKVPEVVRGIFEDAIFYEGNLGDYRYSLTQVVKNAIDYEEKQDKKDLPIFWTTCDVIYEKDFISKCFPYLEKKSIVTSHPHKIVDLQNITDSTIISGLDSGFDMLIFSSSLVSDKQFVKAHNGYVFKDWGVYEHFLISLAELVNDAKMYNVFEETLISKVENNRILTNEPSQFLINSHKRNSRVFKSFLKDHNLTSNYLNLTYCHLKFRVTKKKFIHYSRFFYDLSRYYFDFRFRSLASKVTPRLIKDMIKGKA